VRRKEIRIVFKILTTKIFYVMLPKIIALGRANYAVH
jgi:hypothetical protein